ncbi:MAG: outer membrane protein assembly factor BamE [Acidobacteria bacterium]|nr:outer membrane protein assembly factor BamE [Acidobacteriota bacterium]
MDLTTIRIGRGIGDLPFGLTREQVKELLGEPPRIVHGVEEPDSEIWFYEDRALAVGFEPEYEGRLGSIETYDPRATLNGRTLIGLTIMEVALALKDSFAFPIEAIFGEDEETPEQLRIPDLSISFWNEGIVIESISLGVIASDSGEVLWPEADGGTKEEAGAGSVN